MTDTATRMAGPTERMHRAMAAVLAVDEWWTRPVEELVGAAMREGTARPDRVRAEIRVMLKDRGAVGFPD